MKTEDAARGLASPNQGGAGDWCAFASLPLHCRLLHKAGQFRRLCCQRPDLHLELQGPPNVPVSFGSSGNVYMKESQFCMSYAYA